MPASYDPTPLILGRLIGANMNSIADQAIKMLATKYVVRRVVVTNPSLSLTLAAGGIYSAAAKGGDAIVAAAQLYSALTGASKFLDLTLAAIASTDVRTESTLFLSLTVAQGGAALADLFVIGDVLAP